MTTAFLRVTVPDAERGFVLATQLHERAVVVTGGAADAWEVVVEGGEDVLLAELLSRIAQWLRDEDVGRADVYVNGRLYAIESHG